MKCDFILISIIILFENEFTFSTHRMMSHESVLFFSHLHANLVLQKRKEK